MEKTFSATVKLPCDCTDDEFTEWLEFNLHVRASMSGKNPLADYDLECIKVI